jgi:hypothetical protein
MDHFGRLPFKNPADADKFTDGLRKAGLAEQPVAEEFCRQDGRHADRLELRGENS